MDLCMEKEDTNGLMALYTMVAMWMVAKKVTGSFTMWEEKSTMGSGSKENKKEQAKLFPKTERFSSKGSGKKVNFKDPYRILKSK